MLSLGCWSSPRSTSGIIRFKTISCTIGISYNRPIAYPSCIFYNIRCSIGYSDFLPKSNYLESCSDFKLAWVFYSYTGFLQFIFWIVKAIKLIWTAPHHPIWWDRKGSPLLVFLSEGFMYLRCDTETLAFNIYLFDMLGQILGFVESPRHKL